MELEVRHRGDDAAAWELEAKQGRWGRIPCCGGRGRVMVETAMKELHQATKTGCKAMGAEGAGHKHAKISRCDCLL